MSAVARAIGAGFVALLCTCITTVSAASITATVTDDAGRPLADAVVTITPEPGTPMPHLAGGPIATAVIDQKDEAFVPSVVVIHTGGSVVFRNSDGIRHHVYSFAPVHRFEMVQTPGETSAPEVFDRPGAVAIGCNIHDHMTAYILVTDAPWAMVTDAQGRAMVTGLPAGRFSATVWHPRLRPRVEPPVQSVVLATDSSALTVSLPVLPPRRAPGRGY